MFWTGSTLGMIRLCYKGILLTHIVMCLSQFVTFAVGCVTYGFTISTDGTGQEVNLMCVAVFTFVEQLELFLKHMLSKISSKQYTSHFNWKVMTLFSIRQAYNYNGHQFDLTLLLFLAHCEVVCCHAWFVYQQDQFNTREIF